jgi:hypothetical protein
VSRWPDRWILIPNWDKFQHYKQRDPPWIKLYRELLRKREWRDLSWADRGLLTTVWLMYADQRGELRVPDVINATAVDEELILTRSTKKAHHMRITRGLDRLNHAGFLVVVASRPSVSVSEELHARAREQNGRIPPCEFCEVGGGYHTTDCPTLKGAPDG